MFKTIRARTNELTKRNLCKKKKSDKPVIEESSPWLIGNVPMKFFSTWRGRLELSRMASSFLLVLLSATTTRLSRLTSTTELTFLTS